MKYNITIKVTMNGSYFIVDLDTEYLNDSEAVAIEVERRMRKFVDDESTKVAHNDDNTVLSCKIPTDVSYGDVAVQLIDIESLIIAHLKL